MRRRLAKASDLVPDPSQDRAVPAVDEGARPSVNSVDHNITTLAINMSNDILQITGEGGARSHFAEGGKRHVVAPVGD